MDFIQEHYRYDYMTAYCAVKRNNKSRLFHQAIYIFNHVEARTACFISEQWFDPLLKAINIISGVIWQRAGGSGLERRGYTDKKDLITDLKMEKGRGGKPPNETSSHARWRLVNMFPRSFSSTWLDIHWPVGLPALFHSEITSAPIWRKPNGLGLGLWKSWELPAANANLGRATGI